MYKLKKDRKERFYFTLHPENSVRVIIKSEAYVKKQSCEKAIESIKKNAGEDGRIEKKKSANSLHYFIVKSRNGKVIGVSNMYPSEDKRDEDIAQLLKAKDSETQDMTRPILEKVCCQGNTEDCCIEHPQLQEAPIKLSLLDRFISFIKKFL